MKLLAGNSVTGHDRQALVVVARVSLDAPPYDKEPRLNVDDIKGTALSAVTKDLETTDGLVRSGLCG